MPLIYVNYPENTFSAAKDVLAEELTSIGALLLKERIYTLSHRTA